MNTEVFRGRPTGPFVPTRPRLKHHAEPPKFAGAIATQFLPFRVSNVIRQSRITQPSQRQIKTEVLGENTNRVAHLIFKRNEGIVRHIHGGHICQCQSGFRPTQRGFGQCRIDGLPPLPPESPQDSLRVLHDIAKAIDPFMRLVQLLQGPHHLRGRPRPKIARRPLQVKRLRIEVLRIPRRPPGGYDIEEKSLKILPVDQGVFMNYEPR